jgi:uncharacterized protein YbcV (DUF1398 family)
MDSIIDSVAAAAARGMAARPKVGGFPYLAEALRQAGVVKYYFDVPSMSVVYVTDRGDVLQPGILLRSEKMVIPPYDEMALIDAIRTDQRGESTFPEFVEASLQAGVIRYEVDSIARTCTYFGTHGERYVEDYPAVELPASLTVDA